jgi:hypothetical protein
MRARSMRWRHPVGPFGSCRPLRFVVGTAGGGVTRQQGNHATPRCP